MTEACLVRLRADFSIRVAALVCLFGFGLFGLWATFAPLAEGVTSHGNLVVEENRKVIQHLEGGIVRRIRVKEGDIVAKGGVLVELDPLAATAARNEIANEYAEHSAAVIRLTAQAEGTVPDFSQIIDSNIQKHVLEAVVRRQRDMFVQEAAKHDADNAVLEARIRSMTQREAGRAAESRSLERALRSAERELGMKRRLAKDKFVRLDAIEQLERETASIRRDLENLRSQVGESAATKVEIERQIDQVNSDFRKVSYEKLVEARRSLSATKERLTAAEDVRRRTFVTSPIAGTVLNLKFTTVGGVIRPGEAILEVVPSTNHIIAEVKISPNDRDEVIVGQKVRTRLSAFKSWRAPSFDGTLSSISADLKVVPETGARYFEAKVILSPSKSTDEADQLLPGMPVEVFIYAGTTRTFVDYVLEPILGTFRRGMQM